MPDPQPQARPAPAADEAPRVQLFGAPLLHADGQTVAMVCERRFQILALLALEDGRWVPRERVAALLWPGRPADLARRNLRKVIFLLHGLPGLAALEITDHGLRWPVDSDVGAYLHPHRVPPPDALAVGGETLLAGFDDPANPAWNDWLTTERARVAQAWRRVALTQIDHLADPTACLVLATRLLQADPLDEAAVAALLRAATGHAEPGAQALAQRVFRDYAARLAEELGIEPSAALRALAHTTPVLDAKPLAARGAAHRPAAPEPALASTRPAFVGRRQELATLAALLAEPEARLVTLVGPGGIGKSRLAREAMPHLKAQFPDGCFWIEMHDLESRAQVASRAAQQLGLDLPGGGDTQRAVARWLAEHQALLVFDNAEDLVEAHDLFDALATAGLASRVLVTSRSRTARPGECLLPLSGLACPDEDSHDLASAESFDAVRLFQQRAVVALPSFDLATQLPGVIALVDAVGGMPLALELAASWVRLLPVAEIARDVQDSMEVLERDPALSTPLARPEHASLRAVVERSFALLAPRESHALARLSVFVGGFTRTAAREVAQAPLPLLSSLVDKSLVASSGAGRFSLHPVIAAYAAEVLARQPDALAQAREHHAQACTAALALLAPHRIGDSRPLTEHMQAELPNLAAAWRWAVQAERLDLLDLMARPLGDAFERNGHFADGLALFALAQRLQPKNAAGARAMAAVLTALSALKMLTGALDEAFALARAVVDSGPGVAGLEPFVCGLSSMGTYHWRQGRFDEALACDEQAVAAARRHGDRHCMTFTICKLAVSLQSMGRLEPALAAAGEAVALASETGNVMFLCAALIYEAGMRAQQGQWQVACSQLERAMRLAQETGHHTAALFARQKLGAALLKLGRVADARRHLEIAAARGHTLAMDMVEHTCLRDLARADLLQGQPDAALAHLQPLLLAFEASPNGSLHLRTLLVYGQWLSAAGRPGEAAAVCRCLLADTRLDAEGKADVLTLLGALPPQPGATPTLDEMAAAVRHETALARPGNAQETPPA